MEGLNEEVGELERYVKRHEEIMHAQGERINSLVRQLLETPKTWATEGYVRRNEITCIYINTITYIGKCGDKNSKFLD